MRTEVWVYILRCADDRFYIGSYRGADVEARVAEHNHRVYPKAWTARRLPVVLLWAELFPDAEQAIAFERQIKGWNRMKKMALIEGRLGDLPALARRNKRPRPSRLAALAPQDEGGAAGTRPHPEEPTQSASRRTRP